MATAIDPITSITVMIALAVILLSLVSKLLRIPLLLIYILTGFLLGPSVFNLIHDSEIIHLLGNIGVMLLLFFIGMEISLKKLLENWKVALGGGLLEVLFGLLVSLALGLYLDWPIGRIVLIGFVMTISSTAVVLKVLESRGELKSKIGQNAVGILLVEDILVVPMILTITLLSGKELSPSAVGMQVVGAILIVALLIWVVKKEKISIPFIKKFKDNEEIQVFLALAACFGFAFVTGLFGLSTALGAFVAGMVISATEEKKWIEHHLKSFYVILVAIFFISIGLLIDINFIAQNYKIIIFLVGATILVNTAIITIAMKIIGLKWRESIYTGLMLSQIGEFSFVLASTGLASGTITGEGYSLAISVISLSLVTTPFVIEFGRRLVNVCLGPFETQSSSG